MSRPINTGLKVSLIFLYIDMKYMQAKIQQFQNSFSFFFFQNLIKIYPSHPAKSDTGAHDVSEKFYFLNKFQYIRKLLYETILFVEIWSPIRCINRTTGIFF